MRPTIILALMVGLLAGCSAAEPETPAPAPEGREETRGIRNTENIGVSGDAVADRVDQALDANDRHREQLEQADPQQ